MPMRIRMGGWVGEPMRPPPYTKNYWQLRNAETGKNKFSLGRTHLFRYIISNGQP